MANPITGRVQRVAWRCLPALIGAWLALTALPAQAPAQGTPSSSVPLDAHGRPLYKAGELLVQLKPGLSITSLGLPAGRIMSASQRLTQAGAAGAVHRVKLTAGMAVSDALAQFRSDPAVKAASPNYLNYPASDPDFSAQWGLSNTGQDLYSDANAPCSSTYSQTTRGCFPNTSTVSGDDIDAERAWTLATGSGVIVAVIDTGVDYSHPDLSSQMWSGSTATVNCPDTSGGNTGGSPATHGGCDITAGTNDPKPSTLNECSTHGTHVAGIIAAQSNGTGIMGVAYDAKIMALQVFPNSVTEDAYANCDTNYGATDADIISAINYAVQNGANIINISLGREGASSGNGAEDPLMTTAVQNAVSSGVLLVVAAGNGGSDGLADNNSNPSTETWPANYAGLSSTAAGVISVAATDQADHFTYFSNYSPLDVTIAAPGYNILSTVNTLNETTSYFPAWQSYAYESGTSQASPMVAGVAALVKQANPSFTPAQIKQRLVDTGDALTQDACKIASGKRVNAYNALADITSATPCAAISTLASKGSSCLITYLTRPYLADSDLDPLRRVRDFLWRRGVWGRTLVRLYYRLSGLIIGVLKDAGVPFGTVGTTATI